MHYLPRGRGGGGLRRKGLNIRSKSNFTTFYRSLAMHNHIETQKERFQGTSIQQSSMRYWPRGVGGGRGLRRKGLNIIRSQPNTITFYRSLGMRNHIETQKERSQGTSTQQKSMYHLPRGGGEGLSTKGLNITRSKSNSITFYRSLGMRNHIETQKERSQGTSIQQISMHYLPRGGL